MEEKFDEIEQKVKGIIEDVLQLKEKEIDKNATISDFGGDSLAALTILSALEREFNISIPDEKALKIDSLTSAVEVIRDCLR